VAPFYSVQVIEPAVPIGRRRSIVCVPKHAIPINPQADAGKLARKMPESLLTKKGENRIARFAPSFRDCKSI
jgi:hypothetical protein